MAKKASAAGNDNVFADLGHPRPAEALAKAELARKILEVDQPKVSALIRGRLAGFSLDVLVRFLMLLEAGPRGRAARIGSVARDGDEGAVGE